MATYFMGLPPRQPYSELIILCYYYSQSKKMDGFVIFWWDIKEIRSPSLARPAKMNQP